MAKRYTDTEKYDRAWFRRLSPRMKCAWDWLCCNCDKVGVWNVDMEKLSFEVGESVTLHELQETFKVELFDGDKLFIPSFVPFQYGDASGGLSHTSNFHRDISQQLQLRGFPAPSFKEMSPPPSLNDDSAIPPPPPTPPPTLVGRGRGRGRGSSSSCILAKVWNDASNEHLPKVTFLSPQSKRFRAAQDRWAEHPDEDFWKGIIAKINASPWCNGKNDSGWLADFEFFVRPDTASKVVEGKYDDRNAKRVGQRKNSYVLSLEADEERKKGEVSGA